MSLKVFFFHGDRPELAVILFFIPTYHIYRSDMTFDDVSHRPIDIGQHRLLV